MSIEAISAVGGQLAGALPASQVAPMADANASVSMSQLLAPHSSAVPGQGLFDQLVSSLGEIDSRIAANGRATTELALGQTDNLHQVMINAERTRLQFDLAMSMRNRVLEAYQEIMRMQV